MSVEAAPAPIEAPTTSDKPPTHHLICRQCSWPGPIALCGEDLSDEDAYMTDTFDPERALMCIVCEDGNDGYCPRCGAP